MDHIKVILPVLIHLSADFGSADHTILLKVLRQIKIFVSSGLCSTLISQMINPLPIHKKFMTEINFLSLIYQPIHAAIGGCLLLEVWH